LDGVDGLGVFNGNFFEFLMGQISLVGQFNDILLVVLNSAVKGSDLLVQLVLLNVKNGGEEGLSVSNVNIGRIEFSLDSSDIFFVLESSLLVFLISSLLSLT